MAFMDKDKIDALKQFVKLVKEEPGVLEMPQLHFFRDFILSWGAKIPEEGEEANTQAKSASPSSPSKQPSSPPAKEEAIEEPVYEEETTVPSFDGEDDPEHLEPEDEPLPEESPGEKELSDADLDKQME